MGTGINKVTLLGNLGQSPETKFSKDGAEYCLFSVATDESWRNAKGQKFENVCWHSVIAWKRLANICAKYLHKGSRVYLEGKIQNGKYESDGSIKYFSRILLTDVHMLGGREAGTANGSTVYGSTVYGSTVYGSTVYGSTVQSARKVNTPGAVHGRNGDVTADGDDMPF